MVLIGLCVILYFRNIALTEMMCFIPANSEDSDNSAIIYHITSDCPSTKHLIPHPSSHLMNGAYKPCPICVPDSNNYLGIEAFMRGGTVVIRIPDTELERIFCESPISATLSDSLFPSGGDADSDLAYLLHGKDLLNALQGGVGKTLSQTFLPALIHGDDILLMSQRHLGAAWYFVVRPSKTVYSALKSGDTLELSLNIYDVTLEITRWWYGYALTDYQSVRRVETSICITPEKSANIVIEQDEDVINSVTTTIYRDRNVYTLVIYDHTPMLHDNYVRWTMISGTYSQLNGYSSGEKGVYCTVLSEAEASNFVTVELLVEPSVSAKIESRSLQQQNKPLFNRNKYSLFFTSYGTPLEVKKEFNYLVCYKDDACQAYPIPNYSLLSTDQDGQPVVGWLDNTQVNGRNVCFAWPTSKRPIIKVALPDNLLEREILQISNDLSTIFLECYDSTGNNRSIQAFRIDSGIAVPVRIYISANADEMDELRYFSSFDIDRVAWINYEKEMIVFSDSKVRHSFDPLGDFTSTPLTWLDCNSILLWKSTEQLNHKVTHELYTLDVLQNVADQFTTPNGTSIVMEESFDFPKTPIKISDDFKYAAWFDAFGWGGLTDIRLVSLETGSYQTLDPWPEYDEKAQIYFRDTNNCIRLTRPKSDNSTDSSQLCLVHENE